MYHFESENGKAIFLTDTLLSIKVVKPYTFQFDPDRFPIKRADMTVEKQTEGKRGLRWKAICLGAFVCVVPWGVILLITNDAALKAGDAAWLLILLVVALIGNVIAGLIAGAMAGHRGAVHGILATLIACIPCILIIIINIAQGSMSQVGTDFVFGLIMYLVILMVFCGLGGLGGALGVSLRNHK